MNFWRKKKLEDYPTTTEELEELQRVAQNSINNVVEQTKEEFTI